MLTGKDILTSSGKYPVREKSTECTAEVRTNAEKLAAAVNKLFQSHIALKDRKINVTSGFRTAAANANIPNAAKRSNHIMGLAVDIADADGFLDDILFKNQTALERAGLYLEHPSATKGWCHLQLVAPKSGKRVFMP